MVHVTTVLLMLIINFVICNGQNVANEISVWSFRIDNANNSKVKASYTGPSFTQDIGDFTICFRYQITYFELGNNGNNVILAENGREKVHLRVFNDKWANKFEIITRDGKRLKNVTDFH